MMMKVYVVVSHDWEDCAIEAIFTNRAEAVRFSQTAAMTYAAASVEEHNLITDEPARVQA